MLLGRQYVFTCQVLDLSILPDDNADLFVVALLMSYCSYSSLFVSSTVTITLYTSSSGYFRKWDGLSEGRVVSRTKNEYGFAIYLLYNLLNSAKSILDVWVISISWSSFLLWIFMTKKSVEFSLKSFLTVKYDCVMNRKGTCSYSPLINNSLTKFFITDLISNRIIKNYQDFVFLFWILL